MTKAQPQEPGELDELVKELRVEASKSKAVPAWKVLNTITTLQARVREARKLAYENGVTADKATAKALREAANKVIQQIVYDDTGQSANAALLEAAKAIRALIQTGMEEGELPKPHIARELP